MKKLYIVGVALFAVLAFSVVAVASAVAAPEFLDNGEAILATVPVLSELMQVGGVGLLLEDMGSSTEVECMAGTNEGSLLTTAGTGEITKATCSEALTVSGACLSTSTVIILAANLPWTVTLFLEEPKPLENMLRALINNAAKNTGYIVECTVELLGKIEDPCTGEGISFLVEDAEEGMLLAESDAKTEEESELNISCKGPLGGIGLVLAGSDTLFFSDEGLMLTANG